MIDRSAGGEDESARIESVERGQLAWTVVERPNQRDIAELADRRGVLPADFGFGAPSGARPRLIARPNYFAAGLVFPVQLARPRRLASSDLRLIVGPSFVLLIHQGDLRSPIHLLREVVDDESRRETVMATTEFLVSQIVASLLASAEQLLERLPAQIEALEAAAFGPAQRGDPRDLLILRREHTQLQRMLGPTSEVIAGIAAHYADQDREGYWQSLGDRSRSLLDRIEDGVRSIDALSRTQANADRRRLVHVTRLLTATVAALLPMLVVAIVLGTLARGQSWAEGDWVFEIFLGITIASGLGLLGLFRKFGWV